MGKHSILVIKKDNKYLQYYDKDWNSYLFLNCKLKDKDDIEPIKKLLKEKLNIDKSIINYIGEKTHKKFSEKDKIIKEYTHYFYRVDLNGIELDSNFKWYSYDELLKDKRIMKVNSDIVGFVKEYSEKIYLLNDKDIYKLYSYDDLTSDKRIMKVNSDIVKYIKEFNL